MSDFHQTLSLVTIPVIKQDATPLEKFLAENLLPRQACIILPCLWRDMEGPAMDNIIAQHAAMPYQPERLIMLQQANEQQFREAYQKWSALAPNVTILWAESPRVQEAIAAMDNAGIYTGVPGKGRAVWFAAGYVIEAGRSKFVALHDCDIITFHKDMMTRLIYPLANQALGFEFVKAYFYRVRDGRFMGRVCTKFLQPFVTALLQREKFRNDPYLLFLSEMRYALSGEFAMQTSLLARMRIPSGYDLEVRSLAEILQKTSPGQRAQVDIGHNYDHFHQVLRADSTGDSPVGLEKMVMEITRAIIQILRERGKDITTDDLRSIIPDYQREAQDAIFKLNSVALANGLRTDWPQEETSVETFVRALQRLVREGELAGNGHLADEMRHKRFERLTSERVGQLLDAVTNNVQEKSSPECVVASSMVGTLAKSIKGMLQDSATVLQEPEAHSDQPTLQTWNRIMMEHGRTYLKMLVAAVDADMKEVASK